MSQYLTALCDLSLIRFVDISSQVKEKRARAKSQARTQAYDPALEGAGQEEYEPPIPPMMTRTGSNASLGGARYAPYSRPSRNRSDSISSSYAGPSSNRNSLLSDGSESAVASSSSLGGFSAASGVTRPRSSSTYSNYTGSSRPNSQHFSDTFELPHPPPPPSNLFDHEPQFHHFHSWGPSYASDTGEPFQPLQQHHNFEQQPELWHPQPQYPAPLPYEHLEHQLQSSHPVLPPLQIDHLPTFETYEVSPEHPYPPPDSRYVSPIEPFDSNFHHFPDYARAPSSPRSNFANFASINSLHRQGNVHQAQRDVTLYEGGGGGDSYPRPPRSASSAGSSSRRGSVVPLHIHPRHLATLDEQFGDGGPTPRASDFESSSTSTKSIKSSLTDDWGNVVSPPYTSPSVTSPQDSGYASSLAYPLSSRGSIDFSTSRPSSTFLHHPSNEPLSADASTPNYHPPATTSHLTQAHGRPSLARRDTAPPAFIRDPSAGGFSPLDAQSTFQAFPASVTAPSLLHPQQPQRHTPSSHSPLYDNTSPSISHDLYGNPQRPSSHLAFPPQPPSTFDTPSPGSSSSQTSGGSHPSLQHQSGSSSISHTSSPPQGTQELPSLSKVYPSPVIGGLAAKWEGLKINTDVGSFKAGGGGGGSISMPLVGGASPLSASADTKPALGLAIDENGRATLRP